MKIKILTVCIASAVVTAISAQNKQEKEMILSDIQQMDQKLVNFYKNSQADSLASIFSPNCHFAREFSPIIEGRENVRDMYSKDFKGGVKVTSCKFDVQEQKVYDDLVLEIGTNTIEYTKGPNKILFRDSYNYMFIWKKSKSGKYQIRSAFWNSAKNPCN